MDQQETDEIDIDTRRARINHQIKDTKTSFNLQNFFDRYAKGEGTSGHFASEYGFNHPGNKLFRHYLWLSIKLAALYLAKGYNWLFCRQKA